MGISYLCKAEMPKEKKMTVPKILEAEIQIRDRIVETLKKDTELWECIQALMDNGRGIEFDISPSGLTNCSIIDRDQWRKLTEML